MVVLLLALACSAGPPAPPPASAPPEEKAPVKIVSLTPVALGHPIPLTVGGRMEPRDDLVLLVLEGPDITRRLWDVGETIGQNPWLLGRGEVHPLSCEGTRCVVYAPAPADLEQAVLWRPSFSASPEAGKGWGTPVERSYSEAFRSSPPELRVGDGKQVTVPVGERLTLPTAQDLEREATRLLGEAPQ